MRGIDAAGAYVPRFRLPTSELEEAWGASNAKGIETKALPNADEDTVTMAVAAAETALDSWSDDRSAIASLGLATTTPPLEEGAIAPRVGRALGLPAELAVSEASQSTLAGAQLFRDALSADGPALVIASDHPAGAPADADHPFGAGAAAFVVTDDADVPLVDTASYADESPGLRYRTRGSTDVESLGITTYERDAAGESVSAAIAALDESVEDASAAALHQPNGDLPYRLARRLPVGNEAVTAGVVVDDVGDAGAATIPLGLLAALSDNSDDDRTVAGFFGSGGGAAAFLFEGGLTSNVDEMLSDGTTVDYDTYLRERGYIVEGDVAGGGANVSLPTWRQSLDQRYRLVAGQCVACDNLAFPPEGACPDCNAREGYERVEMPRVGTIEALSVISQGGAPPEFTEQQQRDGAFGVAIVSLSTDAGSVRLPGQMTDVDPADVTVGDNVRAVVRRIYEQEGVPRYGTKFVPA